MPLKDRFRRAIGRTERTSSTSSSSIANPSATPHSPTGSSTPISSTADSIDPSTARSSITLTKTDSRLSTSLTWRMILHSSDKPSKKEKKERKRIEDWEKKDEEEWVEPKSKYPGRKSQKHQDMLRTYEWGFGKERESFEGRKTTSMYSGISPGQSRAGSVNGEMGLTRVWSSGRKRSSGAGAGSLSREVSRQDGPPGQGQRIGSVTEE